MTYKQDEPFAILLRQQAPAARDLVFRLKVLERRERREVRRRALLLLGAALAVAVISLIGVSMGGKTYETARVALFAVATAISGVTYMPALARLLRRFKT